ncbi:hypothetical protein TNCV_371621 [Trichonephila clavipes]|nr:hypothetical protein TNCV_371621 [Trichonephila clavipes]
MIFVWKEATQPFSSVFFNGLHSTPGSLDGVVSFQHLELPSTQGQVSNPAVGVHGPSISGQWQMKDPAIFRCARVDMNAVILSSKRSQLSNV